jgi:sugar lactone lactonase YvrE
VFSVASGAAALFSATGFDTSAMAVDAAQNVLVAAGPALSLIAPNGAVTALAGSTTVGSADGTGAAAQFGCAFDTAGPDYWQTNAGIAGVAAGPAGVYYAADYCNNTIRKITSGGVVTTLAGFPGLPGEADGTGVSARFWGPSGMVVDPSGNLYVADYLNGLIRKVTPAGAVSTYAGQASHAGLAEGTGSAAAFRFPFGIAVDSSGNLYVADTYNNAIRKITPAGVVSNYAGIPGLPGLRDGDAVNARFYKLRNVAVDSAGNVYVADTGNGLIRKIDTARMVTTLASLPPGSTSLHAVAVTSTGDVYFTTLQGVYKVVAGSGTLVAPLANAKAITAGSDGQLYVSAGYEPSRSVSRVSPTGTVTTITSTGLGFVSGIVLAGDGNLYVADHDSSVIRRIVPGTGATTTVVGSTALPLGAALGGLPARLGAPAGLALLSTGTHVSLAVTESYEHSVLRVDLP